jgi:hypothetical protein
MAISITRLSGGTTPANGSDPRTFPAIWNASATSLESVATDLDTAETDIDNLENGKANIINTDGDPGKTIYVGSVDPDVAYTPAVGDVWIEVPA